MYLVPYTTQWKRLILLVAVTASCSAEPQSGADVMTPPLAETLEIVASPRVPAPAAAIAPVARAPVAPKRPARSTLAVPAPALPLEKLLQVPPYTIARPLEPDINELLRLAISPELSGEAASADDESANASRVRVDVDMRTDNPTARPDLKREQVDAAAAIDVGNDTSIKGGVRVERDSNGGVQSNRNTTPTIGVEKRF